jgi:hypothetical protein
MMYIIAPRAILQFATQNRGPALMGITDDLISQLAAVTTEAAIQQRRLRHVLRRVFGQRLEPYRSLGRARSKAAHQLERVTQRCAKARYLLPLLIGFGLV